MARLQTFLLVVLLLSPYLILPAVAQDSAAAKAQSAEEAKLSDEDAAKQAEIDKQNAEQGLTPEEQEKLKQQQEEDAKRRAEEDAKLTPEEQEQLKKQQEEANAASASGQNKDKCADAGESCSKKSCCKGLTCKSGICVNGGGGGDPHFIGLDGSAYDFQGVSGMHFVLVSEPESQLNAQFHNLGMHADNTYIKALGFVHAPSGHQVTVDTQLENCRAGVPLGHALAIHVNGQRVDAAKQTTINRPFLNATLLQLLKDKSVVVDYRATNRQDGLAEHMSIRTGRVMYTIHRNAGSCHLDVDMAVLDPELLGERVSTMHGVLGQTARWAVGSDSVQVVQGDESEYVESSLTSHDSKYSVLAHKARGRNLGASAARDVHDVMVLATSSVYASPCY